MGFNFLEKKFGKEAGAELVKDERGNDALFEAVKDIGLEQGKKGIAVFKQGRNDLRPEDETTNYPEDED